MNNWFYRLQQVVIAILHFILLGWIMYLLQNSGPMSRSEVLYHFLGIAFFGAALIRGCAAWGKFHYLKDER